MERAYAYCEEFARAHHESYPVASRLVPAETAPAPDRALRLRAGRPTTSPTSPQYEGRRVEALDRWEEELAPLFPRRGDPPGVHRAGRHHREARDSADSAAGRLLSAFRTDMEVRRYATFQQLRGYTARSADPVGRLLLALFGYREPELVRYADEISTALQLTNFWQDVAADAARGPHLPAGRGPALLRRDRGRHQGAQADHAPARPAPLRGRAHARPVRTRPPAAGPSWATTCAWSSPLIWLIGTAILDKIEAADYDVFTHRPEITRRDKADDHGPRRQALGHPPGPVGAFAACGPEPARSEPEPVRVPVAAVLARLPVVSLRPVERARAAVLAASSSHPARLLDDLLVARVGGW